MKAKCELIQDLLPLYLDGVCSNESKITVEEHLRECTLCSEKFKIQKSELLVSNTIIKENLKSKKPFKKIKNFHRITILTLLLFMVIAIILMNSNFIWHTNAKNYVEKVYGQPIIVQKKIDYLYKNKKYRIILSTAKYRSNELFLQCFQVELGGLFYKPCYGSSQGDSMSLYGFTNNFILGSSDKFTIVYGYNQDLSAKNFSVKNISESGWVVQDISYQKYFLYAYSDISYGKIIFRDINNKDITSKFIGR